MIPPQSDDAAMKKKGSAPLSYEERKKNREYLADECEKEDVEDKQEETETNEVEKISANKKKPSGQKGSRN